MEKLAFIDCRHDRIMTILKRIVLSSFFLMADPNVLHAQNQAELHPYLTQKFFVDMGVFFPERSLRIEVDGTLSGDHDPIDFQQEFGLAETDEIFSLNFGWRFGKKWELMAQYFAASASVRAVLDEDIEWNDIVFEVGTGVAVGEEFSLVRLFFARRFNTAEHHNLGIGAGLHWLEIAAFIEGTVVGGIGGGAFRRESVRAGVPLPNIGIWYTRSLSPKWAIRTRLDWFSASIGDYGGQIINASAGLNYQLFEHFGLGLNYNFFELSVNVDKSDWRGEVTTRYDGLFANFSFYW